MTNWQKALIVIGSAVLFQVGTALATLDATALDDPAKWLAGLVVGVANAVGVAIVAMKTSGGLSMSKP